MIVRVYVGPSLPDGPLRQFTVFRGRFPSYVEKLIDKEPALRGLFVSPAEVPTAKSRVLRKGDLLHTLSQKILKR